MKRIADDNVLYLLQYLTANLIGRGYVWHCRTGLPERKIDRWPAIVGRINDKYRTPRGDPVFELSRDQRSRRKAGGRLNAALIWWRGFFWILSTAGRDDVGLFEGEHLEKWPRARLVVPAGRNFTYEIKAKPDGTATVGLTKDCFTAKVLHFQDLAKRAPADAVIATYAAEDRLIPAYAGCLAQKRRLVQSIIHAARSAGRTDITRAMLTITSTRPVVGAQPGD